ncbi:DUF1212 domain membrane protein [Cordyceps fumosorosea ARSEF 2679]|uniref:DUF1212 domain membrane protein n=1 Tax=Cordyceps fumosorosea (strain ARSEF 2679) TaxID=1081104 RepID=A0A167NMR7_CORFA|nr:DUF1212 domain membrane protein [Cordyceps fumosorosea ARSEF 2679]OAA55726.1 DUF1212 domain membrane protein [Cordyceps fumosorosea ARSEF 2679]
MATPLPQPSPPPYEASIPPTSGDSLGAARKGKKRVGWHSASGSFAGVSSSKDAALLLPDQVSNNSTPSVQGTAQPGAPDAQELAIALTKILSEKDQQPAPESKTPWDGDTSPQIPAAQTPNLVRPPRPALRRNTSYDAPKEREEADLAEQKASQRQVRSITDARQRADRLAMSVGGYSSPVSKRGSLDSNATFQSFLDDLDERLGYDGSQAPNGSIRHRTPYSSLDHLNVAESLVLSHAMRTNTGTDFFHRHHKSSSSGTFTPITTEDQDYVPRPTQYRGGILSSLLKLYQNDKGQNASGHGIDFSSTATTPVMSPRSSPSHSRRPSTAGSSKFDHSKNLFSYHKSQSSTSSLALNELLKSSSMLAVPVSRQISDQWEHKIKKEKPLKPKKEQARITVHIAGTIARHRYLMKLCRALMMYGAPTHRLEEYMTMSARVLEIESQFLYLPSCMIISFDDSSTHTTEVKLVRVPQGIDLGKLRDVHNIYKHVVHDKLGVEDAAKHLDEVITSDAKFPIWFRIIMYGVASASVAPFAFEGRFIDLPCAFILGCIVGILQLVFAPSNELYAHVFEVSASIITSFIARGFGSINNGQLFCFSALAQSSIALILPGYIVLCASLELQSHNLVAGGVRMVYALIYTLFLGYGITIGATLYGMMDSNAASETHCSNPLDRGWYMFFVPCFTLCLCIVNQAKWRQIPAMLVMAVAGYAVNSYTSLYFKGSGQISNMLGALTVGILANLYSRLGRHADNIWLDFTDWWRKNVTRRYFSRRSNRSNLWTGSISDAESATSSAIAKEKQESRRSVGYSLAAAAMLPAIFVQVPSGLAAGGSLLAGITSANEATGNTTTIKTSPGTLGSMDGTAFNVLFLVIQVAISLSVGLFMSALIVYPLGKRRSGLFSF